MKTPNNVALFNTDLTLWVNYLASRPDEILFITEGCIGIKAGNYWEQIARFLNQDEAIYTMNKAGYQVIELENGQMIAKK